MLVIEVLPQDQQLDKPLWGGGGGGEGGGRASLCKISLLHFIIIDCIFERQTHTEYNHNFSCNIAGNLINIT